ASVSGLLLRDQLPAGLVSARGPRPLLNLMVLACLTTFLGLPLLTFLPLFAQHVFGGGVTEYTRLMACAGVGAVGGALVVAWLGTFPHMGRALLGLQFLLGTVIVAFAASRALWPSQVLL